MNKSKKLMAGAMAFSLMMPMFATPVFATDGTGETKVTYNNSNDIADPDNPANPNWAVEIPSSINFTDANKKIDANVVLKTVNGADASKLPDSIDVKVESTNGYELFFNKTAGEDNVEYIMQYGDTADSLATVAADGTIGTLGKNTDGQNKEQTTLFGQGVLKGTATKTGDHTDTLTYTVSTTVAP